MRIAIDATPLTVATGGIRRYVIELTKALCENFPDDELHLLSNQAWAVPDELRGLDSLKISPPGKPWLRKKWWSAGLPWELQRRRIDVFHGTDFAVPYLPICPSVMTIHDLSPWQRGLLRRRGSDRIRVRTPYLLPLATMIVAPTEAIRRQTIEFFGLSKSRIVAVPLAAGPCFQVPRGVTEVLPALGISSPYLLYVGAQIPRKNVVRLIEAWREVKTVYTKVDLVLVGQPDDDTMRISAEPGLWVCGPLPDTEVRGLLWGAIAFVYPSLYEGFGLPILEAMHAGAPVITSLDPAISEVTAGAALQVDATQTAALRQAIVDVLSNEPLRVRLQARGAERASQFSWRSTALLTRAVYVEALRRF